MLSTTTAGPFVNAPTVPQGHQRRQPRQYSYFDIVTDASWLLKALEAELHVQLKQNPADANAGRGEFEQMAESTRCTECVSHHGVKM